tara:strand:+ start:609 stop:1013 length:405 start_codon:yes stop_codon:yes gene_type:complete
MSISKYKAAQSGTETPRQTEYRIFAEVTTALLSLDDNIDNNKFKGPEFFKVVDWNRRLWMTLQMDLAQADNSLPEELKANLISISMWVERQTREVMKGEASVSSLIKVNRTIMEGLLANEKNQEKAQSQDNTRV